MAIKGAVREGTRDDGRPGGAFQFISYSYAVFLYRVLSAALFHPNIYEIREKDGNRKSD